MKVHSVRMRIKRHWLAGYATPVALLSVLTAEMQSGKSRNASSKENPPILAVRVVARDEAVPLALLEALDGPDEQIRCRFHGGAR